MIKNQHAYNLTKAQRDRLGARQIPVSEDDDEIEKLTYASVQSELDHLDALLREYEANAAAKSVLESTPENLGFALIKARIARNLTHEELAKRLGLKAQQLQRYEDKAYGQASLERIIKVIKALDVGMTLEMRIPKEMDAGVPLKVVPGPIASSRKTGSGQKETIPLNTLRFSGIAAAADSNEEDNDILSSSGLLGDPVSKKKWVLHGHLGHPKAPGHARDLTIVTNHPGLGGKTYSIKLISACGEETLERTWISESRSSFLDTIEVRPEQLSRDWELTFTLK
ncbi:MAG TPA: helix-turn-helix transcriptional regulator [Verrucomicrobiales bacterium]|nr:helix-turn-helix transcriptional regulator [Verrucomicrobiales bacterium]